MNCINGKKEPVKKHTHTNIKSFLVHSGIEFQKFAATIHASPVHCCCKYCIKNFSVRSLNIVIQSIVPNVTKQSSVFPSVTRFLFIFYRF